MLYERAGTAMLASVIAAASVFFVFLEFTPTYVLLSWCGAFIVLYCIRYAELYFFFHSKQRRKHVQRWHISFIISSALAGILWGITGFVLIPETADETRLLLYTCMTLLYACGLSAGALATYTIKLSAYFAFALPCLLPMGIGFLFSEHDFIRTMGLLALIFMMFLVILAIRINQTLTEALKRETENNVLLKELQYQRDKAEALAARMQMLSSQDSLTGIANRRHMDECLEREWQRAIRSGEPLSLIFGDLDYFKTYNDEYGHLAGDECLRLVAEVLHGYSRRASDLAARYGGEEFAIILSNTDAEAALELAESMRNSIESLQIPHNGSEICPYITMSFGVSTILPRQYDDNQEFVHNADRALYQAKAQGRNCTVTLDHADLAGESLQIIGIAHWDERDDGPLTAENVKNKMTERGYRCLLHSYNPHTPIGKHAHIRDEINLILNGELQIKIKSKLYKLKIGDYIQIPGTLLHDAKVVGEQSLRMLVAIRD